MELIEEVRNPFHNSAQREERLISKQEDLQRENIAIEGAMQSQVEDQMYLQKQAELSEIRKWQQDLEPIFKKAFEELSGHRFNDDGTPVKIPLINPILTIDGAYHFINYLKNADHKVMRSNYSDTRINLTLRHGFGFPLTSLIKHYVKVGYMEKNKALMDYLLMYGFNIVESIYYHALNDGERKHESQIHKYSEIKAIGKEQPKKNMWGK